MNVNANVDTLILLLVNISARCLKARHLFAADTASADSDASSNSVGRLEDRLGFGHLLLGGFGVERKPFVLLNLSLFLELSHFLLLLEFLLFEVLFVVRSDSLVAVLRENFDSNFVLS